MKSSSSFQKQGEDSDSDEFNSKSQERSRSLYCRSSEGEMVNLEDFQLVSIAGKGSFGKVYIFHYLIKTIGVFGLLA